MSLSDSSAPKPISKRFGRVLKPSELEMVSGANLINNTSQITHTTSTVVDGVEPSHPSITIESIDEITIDN